MTNLIQKSQIRNQKSRSAGFSMTEIIITVSLFLMLAGIGVGAYFQYYRSALISTDVDSTLTLMKDTRFKAMKNATGDNYGIHLDSAANSIVSFRDSYTPGLSENVVLQLEQLTIKDLNLDPDIGVTNEILFEKTTGKTQNIGSFTIGNNYYDYTYNINLQGVIN